MKKHSASHKTSRLSSKILNISEIERAVDRILFGNRDKLTPDVKDVRKQNRSDMIEKISSIVSEKSKSKESADKEKKPHEFSKEQKIEEKPSKMKNLVVSGEREDKKPSIHEKTIKKDAEQEEPSLKNKDSGESSVSDMSGSFDGLFEKSEKRTVRGSKTEEFQFGGYNIKTSRKDGSKTKEHTLDGIRGKENGKELSAIEKIIKKEVTEFKAEHVEPEKTHRGKLGNYFSEKPKEIGDDVFTKKESDADKPSSSPKKIKLEEITPDGQIQFLKEANQLKSITLKKLGYSEGDWEELDFYPLEEPFAYVEIIREKETLDKRYVLVEIGLSEEESRIFKFMGETLSGFNVDTNELESKGEETYLIEKMEQIIEDYTVKITPQFKKKIVYYLKKQFLGLDKLEVLMKDPNIEDISCDGSGVMLFLYHRKYGSLKSNVTYDDEEELSDFVVKLAQKCGKHISIAEPMIDATMPDGSRLQMTLSTEVTTKGSTFTIRKFREDPFSPPDLIEFNTMSSEVVAYLWLAVENRINVLVAGGTAAGKTSTLNAFSLFIPREAKIVSIEETREINLPHPNWIPGVSRSGFGEVVGGKVVGEIDMYDLMKAALRQRPEYILVGEIRGREAYVLFQAMATGHTTYSTVHADSAASLIHRLEGKPINIPRIMLQALDIVCIQVISRIKNKRARRCKQIIEIIDIDPTTKEILTNEVFCWDPVDDKFVYSGKSYILERIRGEKDLSREEMTQEIKRRAHLLEWMNKNNIREFKKVATLVAQYVENPAQLMEKIRDGKLL